MLHRGQRNSPENPIRSHHKNNDGEKERWGICDREGTGNLLAFWRKIISGGRKTDDLELPCTARHSKLHERLFLSSLEVDSLAWKKLRWTHRMPGSS
jgi:hypothetical protein